MFTPCIYFRVCVLHEEVKNMWSAMQWERSMLTISLIDMHSRRLRGSLPCSTFLSYIRFCVSLFSCSISIDLFDLWACLISRLLPVDLFSSDRSYIAFHIPPPPSLSRFSYSCRKNPDNLDHEWEREKFLKAVSNTRSYITGSVTWTRRAP